MSDEELRDELMTLLVAGHETTATALAWALERLVRHPGDAGAAAEEATGGDEYADAVIKETLRLRPVCPSSPRRLTEPIEIGGYELPAGVDGRALHLPRPPPPRRLPRARTRFRPERFLEQPAGTYTWIPFGGGVRRCLGASFAHVRDEGRARGDRPARRACAPVDAAPERVARRAITLTPEPRRRGRRRSRARAAGPRRRRSARRPPDARA